MCYKRENFDLKTLLDQYFRTYTDFVLKLSLTSHETIWPYTLFKWRCILNCFRRRYPQSHPNFPCCTCSIKQFETHSRILVSWGRFSSLFPFYHSQLYQGQGHCNNYSPFKFNHTEHNMKGNINLQSAFNTFI